jgi:uncharacterized OB-fold protein
MEFKGTPLKDKDIKEKKVFYVDWHVKAHYAWDCGIALSYFFEGLKNGKIYGRRCPKCKRVMVPPRMFCELCFHLTDKWILLKDTGRVNTFSVSYLNWDASRREKPQVPAVIEIDGASEGMGILHLIAHPEKIEWENLEEVLKYVKVGTKVKAVWKDEKEREGKITDIKYFIPIKEEK